MENEKLQEQISSEVSKQVSQKVSEFVSKVLDSVMNEEFAKRIASITNKSLELTDKAVSEKMEQILKMQAINDDEELAGPLSSLLSVTCCENPAE
jgi:uncharacterized protein YigA (DUF484 family)